MSVFFVCESASEPFSTPNRRNCKIGSRFSSSKKVQQTAVIQDIIKYITLLMNETKLLLWLGT